MTNSPGQLYSLTSQKFPCVKWFWYPSHTGMELSNHSHQYRTNCKEAVEGFMQWHIQELFQEPLFKITIVANLLIIPWIKLLQNWHSPIFLFHHVPFFYLVCDTSLVVALPKHMPLFSGWFMPIQLCLETVSSAFIGTPPLKSKSNLW